MDIRPYKICTKTVMDTSDPDIIFDKNGISNHYFYFHKNVKPNWHPDEQGQVQLERRVEAIKKAGKGKDFDCLLGLSGGTDSSFMLHTIVKKFGLRPLVFHVDGGWNTESGVHNIHVLVDKLGLDLYTEVINWEEMRDFQLAWIKSGVPHIDIPQDHSFIAVLYKFAEKYGIKNILNGGNISTECVINPLQFYYWGTDIMHIRDIIRQFCSIPLQTYPFSSIYRHKIFLRYLKGVKVFKPLNFIPYTKQSAIDLLINEYGWKPFTHKHFESHFTKFLESYWLPTRFGFDPRRVQYSSLILTGQITREDALRELEKSPYCPETIEQDFDYIATKLGITPDELRDYHQMPKKFYWDYSNQSKLLILFEKIVTTFKISQRGGAY